MKPKKIKETPETRKMRIDASFGKFQSKTWDGKKSNKQKRQAWKQRGEHEE